MADKTHWKKLTNPEYLGAYSLDEGEERTITIKEVVRKTITGADGKNEECTVAILENEKPFILNVTNCKTLTKLYGTPYIEDWKNKMAIVYSQKIKAFGETVDALRIKNTMPSLPALTPDHPKWNDAIKALQAKKVTIETIKSRYALDQSNENLLKQAV